MTIKEKVLRPLEVLWNYHQLNHEIVNCDAIFAFGSSDTSGIDYSIDLIKEGICDTLLIAGGYGKITKEIWKQTEAEKFRGIAISAGINAKNIIIETNSSNTGENILFIKDKLNKLNRSFELILLISKPYMERRIYATCRKLWPEQEILVSSQKTTLIEYLEQNDAEKVINLIVGDTQRIKKYAELGFQIKQPMPQEVWNSYNDLKSMGYVKYIIG